MLVHERNPTYVLLSVTFFEILFWPENNKKFGSCTIWIGVCQRGKGQINLPITDLQLNLAARKPLISQYYWSKILFVTVNKIQFHCHTSDFIMGKVTRISMKASLIVFVLHFLAQISQNILSFSFISQVWFMGKAIIFLWSFEQSAQS